MTDDVQRFATRFAAHHQHYSGMGAGRFKYAPDDDDTEHQEDNKPRRRRRRGVLRRGIVLLSLFGLGWAIYDDPSRVGRWWSAANETFGPAISRMIDEALEPSPAVASTETTSNGNITVASTTPTLQLRAPPVQVVRPDPVDVRDNVTAKAEAEGERKDETAKTDAPKIIATLPPVRGVVKRSSAETERAATQDNFEARAQTAGLHPKLSRVLLAKLSKDDFRNARYAIRTALAKTPDDATFQWPRKRKAKSAMFEVRFVPGAAKGCRRYVVTIEMDRWLTTALPMEKCGVKRAQASRATKS